MWGLVCLLKESTQEIQDMMQNWRIYYAYNWSLNITLLAFLVWTIQWKRFWNIAHGQLFIFIILVRCRFIIATNDLDDKRHEILNENGSAVLVLTPLFEKVYELLTEVTFAVFSFENCQ